MESEFRRDVVSGDWILISPRRGKRPDELTSKERPIRTKEPITSCPLEVFLKPNSEGQLVIAAYPDKDQWKVLVVPNKYPAVYSKHDVPREALPKLVKETEKGPYLVKPGFGAHELIITRDHDNAFPELSREDAVMVIGSFRDRYLKFLNDKEIVYVGMFHNFGSKAGASLYHPHYQILAVSVLPPDIQHSLRGSAHYFEKHGECVHCEILAWEVKEGKRIIFENEWAVALAPYFSRVPFEVRIFPKKHFPYFEDTPTETLVGITEALQESLRKIKKALDPDYNFFIHTAPIKDKETYTHYHWHIEILPKLSNYAGFELQTGIEINVVDPDEAARFISSGGR